MSRWVGNDRRCPVCRLTYRRFRCSISRYRDVFELMADYFDDSTQWTYKRRHTVLGRWHQWKLEEWEHHCDTCEEVPF